MGAVYSGKGVTGLDWFSLQKRFDYMPESFRKCFEKPRNSKTLKKIINTSASIVKGNFWKSDF